MELQTFMQFLVASFMSLGALSVFVWAILSGQFNNIEGPKYKTLRMEVRDDEQE